MSRFEFPGTFFTARWPADHRCRTLIHATASWACRCGFARQGKVQLNITSLLFHTISMQKYVNEREASHTLPASPYHWWGHPCNPVGLRSARILFYNQVAGTQEAWTEVNDSECRTGKINRKPICLNFPYPITAHVQTCGTLKETNKCWVCLKISGSETPVQATRPSHWFQEKKGVCYFQQFMSTSCPQPGRNSMSSGEELPLHS